MDQQEYNLKYVSMRILKSIQEYLKAEEPGNGASYTIKVPDELLYYIAKMQSRDEADRIIYAIFRQGLKLWADKLFDEVFGSGKKLESFIDLIQKADPGGAATA